MDHAINSLQPYLDAEIEELREEWHSGKYKKLSDCPSYASAKAIRDAMNVLYKFYYGRSMSTVSELVEY